MDIVNLSRLGYIKNQNINMYGYGKLIRIMGTWEIVQKSVDMEIRLITIGEDLGYGGLAREMEMCENIWEM